MSIPSKVSPMGTMLSGGYSPFLYTANADGTYNLTTTEFAASLANPNVSIPCCLRSIDYTAYPAYASVTYVTCYDGLFYTQLDDNVSTDANGVKTYITLRLSDTFAPYNGSLTVYGLIRSGNNYNSWASYNSPAVLVAMTIIGGGNVTTLSMSSYTFSGDTGATGPLKSFYTELKITGTLVFAYNSKMTSCQFDTSALATATSFFRGCTVLTDLPTSYPALSSAANMFDSCSALTAEQITAIIDSLPTYTSGTHNIGFASVSALSDTHSTTAASKGWTVVS